jgi:hypothetical protein
VQDEQGSTYTLHYTKRRAPPPLCQLQTRPSPFPTALAALPLILLPPLHPCPLPLSPFYLTLQELLNTKWTKKKWDGPLQYENPEGNLMMLPTDMALVWDRKFKK